MDLLNKSSSEENKIKKLSLVKKKRNRQILSLLTISFAVFLGIYLCRYYIEREVDKNSIISVYPGEHWMESSGDYSDSAVCDLRVSGSVKFKDNIISIEADKEGNSTKLTFVDLNSNDPYMIGNLGDKVNLIKIDSSNIIYLIEETYLGYINIFTFFRDKNIMILSKQYELINFPFGMIMMGDCISGLE